MSLTRKENQEINQAALASFLASDRKCVQELTVVPPCIECGFVPEKYWRTSDNPDSDVHCLDRAACYKRQNTNPIDK